MSMHRSLKGANKVAARRNVLKRFERIEVMKAAGKWKEGISGAVFFTFCMPGNLSHGLCAGPTVGIVIERETATAKMNPRGLRPVFAQTLYKGEIGREALRQRTG